MFITIRTPIVLVVLSLWIERFSFAPTQPPTTATTTTSDQQRQTDRQSCATDGDQSTSVASLVRKRGFIAEQHCAMSGDGYRFTLTRVLNPLINGGVRGLANKRPLLFVPGESATGAMFIANSLNVRPMNFASRLDVRRSRLEDLVESLRDEPVSRSLVFLASSFGHECWLLNRRGTPESLGHIAWKAYKDNSRPEKLGIDRFAGAGSSSNSSGNSAPDPLKELGDILADYQSTQINPRYWGFSLDEQAKLDLPKAIHFVLSATCSDKLALVGHSTGSALALMMFVSEPHMQQKVSSSILWSPSLYQSRATSSGKLKLEAVEPALLNYTGPFSTSASSTKVQKLALQACQAKFNESACDADTSGAVGKLGNEDNSEILDAVSKVTGKPVSSWQSLQLVQNRHKGKMYQFDFGDEQTNSIRYGQAEPPLYDVSQISSQSISFWFGSSDQTATPEDVLMLINDLRVRIRQHFYNQSDLYFDHRSPLIHRNVSSLVVIPSLKEIESHA